MLAEAGQRLAGFVRAAPDDGELSEFLAALRKPPKPPRVTPLIRFLQEAGGIKGAGREIKALGLTRARPGPINNRTGRDLDDAAPIATEAGSFGGQGRVNQPANPALANVMAANRNVQVNELANQGKGGATRFATWPGPRGRRREPHGRCAVPPRRQPDHG